MGKYWVKGGLEVGDWLVGKYWVKGALEVGEWLVVG